MKNAMHVLDDARGILFSLALGTALLSGCAVKTGNETLGKYEKHQIDEQITKGKSTKDEVRAMLGDPDKTDLENGMEKWTYTHKRADSKAINYIPVANWFVHGTNDTTKTVVILFDEKDVVKNYINTDAKGETKGGLFQ